MVSTGQTNYRDLMPPDFLDCRHEVVPVQLPPSNKRIWFGKDIAENDWLFRFDDATLDEIRRACDFIAAHPVADKQRRPSDLALPLCERHFLTMRETLDHGVGFCVADRLPVDDYPLDTLVELYWVLGQFIGNPVAQKRNGQMIYDVRDTNKAFSYGVRGSWTNIELNFHTDNAFGKKPPDYVGLFCRHPAKTGGISRFCSLYALHQRLLNDHPAALQRLYQPMLYDRQKEHLEDEAKVTLAPFFSWRQNQLRARANPSLVRKGHDIAGIALDKELESALHIVDEVSKAPEFWFEAALDKGQIQYLNNVEVGHYRSEFVDFDDTEKKRHLFRLWHRNEGSVSYDGDTL